MATLDAPTVHRNGLDTAAAAALVASLAPDVARAGLPGLASFEALLRVDAAA